MEAPLTPTNTKTFGGNKSGASTQPAPPTRPLPTHTQKRGGTNQRRFVCDGFLVCSSGSGVDDRAPRAERAALISWTLALILFGLCFPLHWLSILHWALFSKLSTVRRHIKITSVGNSDMMVFLKWMMKVYYRSINWWKLWKSWVHIGLDFFFTDINKVDDAGTCPDFQMWNQIWLLENNYHL